MHISVAKETISKMLPSLKILEKELKENLMNLKDSKN